MQNASLAAGASNVVRFPAKARPTVPNAAPTYAIIVGDETSVTSSAPWFFDEAHPLLTRIMAHLPYTLGEVRRSVEAGMIVAVAEFAGGRLRLAGLAHEGAMPDGAVTMFGLIESDGGLSRLEGIANYLEGIAYTLGHDAVVLWSPSDLTTMPGWTPVEVPGVEAGSALRREIDD